MLQFSNVEFNSNILKTITTLDHYKQILSGESTNMPNIVPLLDELADFIRWEGEKKDLPTPKPGVDQEYDGIKLEIKDIEDQFMAYLKQIRQKFNNN